MLRGFGFGVGISKLSGPERLRGAPGLFLGGGGLGLAFLFRGLGLQGFGIGFEGSGTESEEQSRPAPISEAPETQNPATLNPAYPPKQGSSDLTLGPNPTSQILTPELPSLPKAVRTSPKP